MGRNRNLEQLDMHLGGGFRYGLRPRGVGWRLEPWNLDLRYTHGNSDCVTVKNIGRRVNWKGWTGGRWERQRKCHEGIFKCDLDRLRKSTQFDGQMAQCHHPNTIVCLYYCYYWIWEWCVFPMLRLDWINKIRLSFYIKLLKSTTSYYSRSAIIQIGDSLLAL